MKPRCHFHSDRQADYTDSIVDISGGTSLHEVTYKRVPICCECADLRTTQTTNRIELIEPTYFCGAQYCDDPACGTHGSNWVEWRKDQ
jgi:hypothetical protein